MVDHCGPSNRIGGLSVHCANATGVAFPVAKAPWGRRLQAIFTPLVGLAFVKPPRLASREIARLRLVHKDKWGVAFGFQFHFCCRAKYLTQISFAHSLDLEM